MNPLLEASSRPISHTLGKGGVGGSIPPDGTSFTPMIAMAYANTGVGQFGSYRVNRRKTPASPRGISGDFVPQAFTPNAAAPSPRRCPCRSNQAAPEHDCFVKWRCRRCSTSKTAGLLSAAHARKRLDRLLSVEARRVIATGPSHSPAPKPSHLSPTACVRAPDTRAAPQDRLV